ncbi:MAG: radical SAM protein [Muribaculum sp.]|nr:radical SAM protein [Muribaculum sp.]
MNEIIQAPIFGISRHRLTTDGRGVTTLVTFHGCSLHCKYCLNPQCLDLVHTFPQYSPQPLFETVKKDDLYFRATGGGITFGGGEPCLRANFITEFKRLCPSEWNLRLETALSVPTEYIEQPVSVIDEWIVDIKSMNSDVFRSYTTKDIELRDKNLLLLSNSVPLDNIIVKIPIIPEFKTQKNTEEDKEILKKMGFTRFEIVEYVVDRPSRYSSLIPGMLPGKAKCTVMKRIRKMIADANGIEIPDRKCNHQEDCIGTCPLCEQELSHITKIIQLKIKQNEPVCL